MKAISSVQTIRSIVILRLIRKTEDGTTQTLNWHNGKPDRRAITSIARSEQLPIP